jgi:hypothetical protein
MDFQDRIRDRRLVALGVAVALAVLSGSSAAAAFGLSLGPIREVKLVEDSRESQPLALSSDGRTALASGFEAPTSEGEGLVSLLRRSRGSWSLQGGPFSFPGAEVRSAALAANGSTALVGLPFGTGSSGAYWGRVVPLTRSGSTWREGEILANPEQETTGSFGGSVALSADGNTALILSNEEIEGVPGGEKGTAYIYVREGSAWRPQGTPLLFRTQSRQDTSAALSADGSTALIDFWRRWFAEGSEGVNAPWVFMRSGSGWTARQLKPRASEETIESPTREREEANVRSVALSADGTTAIVGSPFDNHQIGAAWVFTREGSTWTQQGPKLTGRNEVGAGGFGQSIALSANGNIAVVGSLPCRGVASCGGELQRGQVWVLKRKGSTWKQPVAPLTCDGCTKIGQHVALVGRGKTALVSVQP